MSEACVPAGAKGMGGASVVVGGMVLALVAIHWVADIVGPAFLVITLVITVQPLRRWLERHRVAGWASGIAALVAVYGLLLTILGSLVWSLAQLAAILPSYSAAFAEIWAGVVVELKSLGITASAVSEWLHSIDLSSLAAGFSAILGSLTSGLSTLTLLFMLVFFITLDAAGFERRLQFIARFRPRMAEGLAAFGVRVRRYWLVTSAFGLIVAVLDTIGLALLSVPLAVTWGVLAFITNYIPNVGFFIGLLPPVLIALVDEGPGWALAVVVVYAVINLVIQTIIQPRVTGDVLGLAPSVGLLSLLLWSVILGPLGALLAIPATLLLKSLLVDHNPNTRWLAGLLDAGASFPAPGPTQVGESDQPVEDRAPVTTP